MLVRRDHVARCAAERGKTERELLARAPYELILYS